MERDLAEAIVAAAEKAAGLEVRVGIADGKFAAYVAALLGVNEPDPSALRSPNPDRSGYSDQPLSLAPHVVSPGESQIFLADLSIEDLPVSVEMRRRLRLFGVRRLADLAQLPQSAVTAQFGAEGARASELAHGVDRSPIAPYVAPKSITERLAFGAPVDSTDALLAAVRTLLSRALHRPAIQGRAARAIQLRVHLEDGRLWAREVTFREPVGSSERMLVALKHKIEGAELPAPFTEVELTIRGICGESAPQGNLFTVERGRQLQRVAEAARQLKARYGRPLLAKVIEVEPWSRIPERRFALIDYDP